MSIIVNSMWGFVFALMKCSYAAFGEQNKTDNDSKCQQVYNPKRIVAFLALLKVPIMSIMPLFVIKNGALIFREK